MKSANMGKSTSGHPIETLFPNRTHVLTLSESVAVNNVVPLTQNQVRLYATGDCHLKFSTTGEAATVNECPLPAGIIEYFYVEGHHYISAILAEGESVGKLYITEMG
jgi:hypothetical protein